MLFKGKLYIDSESPRFCLVKPDITKPISKEVFYLILGHIFNKIF